MSSYNKAILVGRVGKAPKTNEAGTKTQISLATDRNYKDKDGNWQTEAQWHNVVLFGKQAEYAAQYAGQGAEVRIEGEICYGEYTNKENVKVKFTEIRADRVKVTAQAKRAGQAEAVATAADQADEFDEANPQF